MTQYLDDSLYKPRRERSANFTAREQWVFLDLMEKFGPVLLDRHNDLATTCNKEAAWSHLVNTFNMKPGVTKRTEKSLKNLWRRVKLEAKKERKELGISGPSGLEIVKAKAAAAAMAAGWKDDISDKDVNNVQMESFPIERGPPESLPNPLPNPQEMDADFLQKSLSSYQHNPLLYDLVKLSYYQQGQSPFTGGVPDLMERMMGDLAKGSPGVTEPDSNLDSETQPDDECPEDDSDDDVKTQKPLSTQTSEPSETEGTSQSDEASGPYLLKKETHCTTILDQLMRDETFTDVTLTAEGQSIRAHRVVLCLASVYFREVLSRDSNVQSVVVLRDVKYEELRNIINFIYTGEATVDASELESFMQTAELLEISSLCEGHKSLSSKFLAPSKSKDKPPPTPPTTTKRSKKDVSNSPPPKSRKISDMKKPEIEKKESFPIVTNSNEAQLCNTEDEDRYANDDAKHNESPKLKRNTSLDKTCSDIEMTEFLDPEPGRCPHCSLDSLLFEASSLENHLQTEHMSQPSHMCETCIKVFVHRSHYDNHKQFCSPVQSN